MEKELSKLTTESRNVNSMNLSQLSTLEVLQTINKEDKKVAYAVEKVLPAIEVAIEHVYQAFQKGGRLFYVGAGTSGRLGVIDASECPPTFMTPPEMVQTIMAGGNEAFTNAVEGAEDNEKQGANDLFGRALTKNDVVIGITASGRTPYPIGAVKYARDIGAFTVSLSCNDDAEISKFAACNIEVIVEPEVLTGSTRMKAATAHKMVLNMISTTVMVKLGKVYENLMVDVHASNHKLMERAKSIIMEITNVPYEEAEKILVLADNEVKPAIVMIEAEVSLEKAKEAILKSNGYVGKAIEHAKKDD
ncbi:N-acetylmuramic acid 6-phosphate etherase [Salipaludibacillus neizhouensis]|uniref:N-acetylmuramic acid 6-phosphate etherase n=1 Tax=Salipaludibacillus neizhouensis TaxID=885475 RepID=A0A3A9K2L5_9BACI|nr:N-acetylmuramic acid 6-phosphate etherase [Salipaludibacillus neizhouensis]RKL66589.1 N-acetylmuramic acid 6-phosphate etherase [Salipaludibacillus neizhouensis]